MPSSNFHVPSEQTMPRWWKPELLIGLLINLQQWKWPPIASEEKIAPNSRKKGMACPLTALPPEIMLLILKHLDVVSLVCLRSINRAYHRFIPAVHKSTWSRCEGWLITCRFEKDMDNYPALVACALCKTKHDQSDFTSHGKNGMKHLNMMASDPVERYCYRHLPLSMCYPSDCRDGAVESSRWVRSLNWTCLHCGCKPDSCGQLTHNLHSPGVRWCRGPAESQRCCSVCPSAYLPTFFRLGPIEGIPTYRHEHHLAKSRFVRSWKTGYRLEMVESNGKAGSVAPPSP